MRLWKKTAACLLALGLAGCLLAGCGAEKENTFVPGTITQTGYTSPWIGLTFTLPGSGMTMQSQEDIRQAAGDTMAEDTADKIADSAELMVTTERGDTMAVGVVEDPENNLTEQAYLDQTQRRLEQYKAEETTYAFDAQTARTIAGQPFTALTCTMHIKGSQPVEMKQTILVQKKENLFYQIVISYYDEAALEAFLDCFSAA